MQENKNKIVKKHKNYVDNLLVLNYNKVVKMYNLAIYGQKYKFE